MSKELYYLIIYLALGFSAVPFCLNLFLFFKRKSLNLICVFISILEFSTFFTNVFLNVNGLGHLKLQFIIYYILVLICWNVILHKYYLNVKKSVLLIVLSAIFIGFCFTLDKPFILQFFSRCIQFLLGILILLDLYKDSIQNLNEKKEFLKYTALGLVLYSFVSMNLSIFRNVLIGLTHSDYALAWTTHQFAAIIYFSLLSISIWKSQKI